MKAIENKVIVCAVVCMLLGVFISPVLALTFERKEDPSYIPKLIAPIAPSSGGGASSGGTSSGGTSGSPTINIGTPGLDALLANLGLLPDGSLIDANSVNPLEPGSDQDLEPDPFNPDLNNALISATPSDVFTEPEKTVNLEDLVGKPLPSQGDTITIGGREFTLGEDAWDKAKEEQKDQSPLSDFSDPYADLEETLNFMAENPQAAMRGIRNDGSPGGAPGGFDFGKDPEAFSGLFGAHPKDSAADPGAGFASGGINGLDTSPKSWIDSPVGGAFGAIYEWVVNDMILGGGGDTVLPTKEQVAKWSAANEAAKQMPPADPNNPTDQSIPPQKSYGEDPYIGTRSDPYNPATDITIQIPTGPIRIDGQDPGGSGELGYDTPGLWSEAAGKFMTEHADQLPVNTGGSGGYDSAGVGDWDPLAKLNAMDDQMIIAGGALANYNTWESLPEEIKAISSPTYEFM